MLDIRQVHRDIVRPVCRRLMMDGLAAERLVIGTALTESRLTQIDQIEAGGDLKPGPAFGIYQMERATHDDLWKNYLPAHSWLNLVLRKYAIEEPSVEQLAGNLYYATALCRVQYWRQSFSLRDTDADNAVMLAQIWKTYWNTAAGKGDAAQAAERFKLVISMIK